MRKILIVVVILLLLVISYCAIFRGISLGSFSILSVSQIADANAKLENEIAITQQLMKGEYQTKTAELETSISTLLEAKTNYYDLAGVSTDGEIQKANQDEIYTPEFLLATFGRHATSQGVNLNYEISPVGSSADKLSNINFTVNGGYIQIINFITAIEDDSKLGFRIQNFKMEQGTGEGNIRAQFLVANVKINQEINDNNGGDSETPSDSNTEVNNDNESTESNTETNTTTENTENTETNTTTESAEGTETNTTTAE